MRRILCVAIVLALPRFAQAQGAARFIGNWRLVSFLSIDSAGREQPFWNDQALGLISYSADGLMSVQLYDARRAGLRTNWPTVNADTARAAYVGLATYFGTFTVDTVTHTVTHHLQGASVPEWMGTDFVRAYRFLSPDRLELGLVDARTRAASRPGAKLVWQRIRP